MFRINSLSDIYLDAFASTIPEHRRTVCFYEDFMSDEVGWINRVHSMCHFPLIERDVYVNQAKLVPTASVAKRAASEQYSQWFLANYV